MIRSLIAETQESQIVDAINGKRIACVIDAHTPKKIAWYYGDPKTCNSILKGKIITKASSFRGIFQIKVDKVIILFSEGIELKFHPKHTKYPDTPQLLFEFEDCSVLSVSVKAYGGIWCYNEGEMDNPYFGVKSPFL